MGTLTGRFFNHMIISSSSSFTELILTGERVKGGIRSGKIQVDASSSTIKKKFNGKKEIDAVYGPKGRGKNDCVIRWEN